MDRLLPMLGRGRSAAIRGYRKPMREELEEPYEKAETWGQAVKGNEAFADRMLQAAGERRVLRRNLTVEAVARRVAQAKEIGPGQMMTRGRGRAGSEARALTAWVGREVAGTSIARTAKHFGRDTSSMARNVARLEERMTAARDLRRLCDSLVASSATANLSQYTADPASDSKLGLRNQPSPDLIGFFIYPSPPAPASSPLADTRLL